jgi:predicted transcriptional regulator
MKLYEQLCFDLLKEYQTTNPTNSNPKTLAITEILKKANVTDQNVLKAIADILDQDEDKKQTSTNVQQTTPTGAVIPPATSTPGIKS